MELPNIINLLKLTAECLPILPGISACIVLAGTDLTSGCMVGLAAFVAAIINGAVVARQKAYGL